MAICSSQVFVKYYLLLLCMRMRIRIVGADVHIRCQDAQKDVLLQLRNELIFHPQYSMKLVNWNQTPDCCGWDGVECDDAGAGAGLVTALLLSDEFISGGINDSSSLFRLTFLRTLDLSSNLQPFNNTRIPRGILNLTSLTYLDLSGAGFVGPIPSTLTNLTHLLHLDLSSNFLSCSLSNFHFPNTLAFLALYYNSLSGPIPTSLFSLPSLEYLFLSNNQFSEQVSEFPIVNTSNLVRLDLRGNRLEGPIPHSFFHLRSLNSLLLSGNSFNATFQLQIIQGLPNLRELDLSSNNLSVQATNMSSASGTFPQLYYLSLASCNVYDFPDLRTQSCLLDLDLSDNRIAGYIPSWFWEIGNGRLNQLNLSCNMLEGLQKPYHIHTSLGMLDLHSNQLRSELPPLPQGAFYVDYSSNNIHSPIPPTISQNIPPSLLFLSLANNSLSGAIPSTLCNATYLKVLNLSFNNLSGHIPRCLLKNIESYLGVLNLRGNNIHGVIPDRFSTKCRLRTLDISNNKLGGKIPKSLANCNSLAVLNLGHNKFDDRFPCTLPTSLRVLVLRSNRFHGELRCDESWPNLQILDTSSNNFSGTLHPLNWSSWRGMMKQGDGHQRLSHSASNFLSPYEDYRDEVTLTLKGVEVNLVKIWPDFTSVDFSCNNFHGDIPDAIGNLTSLYVLNLSHNALTGTIPKSLGSLTELGSLDLSQNQLTGRMPEGLARLTFLSILNVSYNQLVGIIPNGPQFQTFSADWFEGNPGLCGFPLDKSCSNTHGTGSSPTKPKQEEVEEIEWEYVCGAVGYVVGLGSIVWMLIFCPSFREIYDHKIEEILERRRRAARTRAMKMRRRRKRKEEVRRRY